MLYKHSQRNINIQRYTQQNTSAQAFRFSEETSCKYLQSSPLSSLHHDLASSFVNIPVVIVSGVLERKSVFTFFIDTDNAVR